MAGEERKQRKPQSVRKAIRAIMAEENVNYTTALRRYEERLLEKTQSDQDEV